MEPQLPKPQFNQEARPQASPPAAGGEFFKAPPLPETRPVVEQGSETKEGLADGPKGDPAAAQPAFTPPPLPVIDPVQGSTTSPKDDHTASNPATAGDDDLIEQEWVEKAKKVVAENRDDPHAQDIAIGRLQADYLKKRYGKIIALPKEE